MDEWTRIPLSCFATWVSARLGRPVAADSLVALLPGLLAELVRVLVEHAGGDGDGMRVPAPDASARDVLDYLKGMATAEVGDALDETVRVGARARVRRTVAAEPEWLRLDVARVPGYTQHVEIPPSEARGAVEGARAGGHRGGRLAWFGAVGIARERGADSWKTHRNRLLQDVADLGEDVRGQIRPRGAAGEPSIDESVRD